MYYLNLELLKLMFILLSATIILADVPRRGDCSTEQGILYLDPVMQYKEVWCWAASSNAVSNFYELADPRSETTPPDLYAQCRLYNIAKFPNGNFDCCPDAIRSDDRCLQTGWPHEVFDRLNPQVTYNYTEAPLLWDDIKMQICGPQSPGRPIIYAAKPNQGIPHTYTIKGFSEDPSAQEYNLLVDSHQSVGPEDYGALVISYDCYQTGWCYNAEGQGAIYTHVGDYSNISPIDTNSP